MYDKWVVYIAVLVVVILSAVTVKQNQDIKHSLIVAAELGERVKELKDQVAASMEAPAAMPAEDAAAEEAPAEEAPAGDGAGDDE